MPEILYTDGIRSKCQREKGKNMNVGKHPAIEDGARFEPSEGVGARI